MDGGSGLSNARVPVIVFMAVSGTGKTTLLRRVLRLLDGRGLRVGVVKQARDDFDVDMPGKDSYELRKAGVARLLLASARRSALVIEHPHGAEPELNELLALFDQEALDLILVEGFAAAPFPKIALRRTGDGAPRRAPDPFVIALATDRAGDAEPGCAVLDINDPAAVADFILARLEKRR